MLNASSIAGMADGNRSSTYFCTEKPPRRDLARPGQREAGNRGSAVLKSSGQRCEQIVQFGPRFIPLPPPLFEVARRGADVGRVVMQVVADPSDKMGSFPGVNGPGHESSPGGLSRSVDRSQVSSSGGIGELGRQCRSGRLFVTQALRRLRKPNSQSKRYAIGRKSRRCDTSEW